MEITAAEAAIDKVDKGEPICSPFCLSPKPTAVMRGNTRSVGESEIKLERNLARRRTGAEARNCNRRATAERRLYRTARAQVQLHHVGMANTDVAVVVGPTRVAVVKH